MSLGYAHVLADDNRLYKDPVVSKAPEYEWFICFDEDDPVELVIRNPDGSSIEEMKRRATELLSRFEIHGRIVGAGKSNLRLFPPDWFEGGFVKATSFWIQLRASIPAGLIIVHKGYSDEV